MEPGLERRVRFDAALIVDREPKPLYRPVGL